MLQGCSQGVPVGGKHPLEEGYILVYFIAYGAGGSRNKCGKRKGYGGIETSQ